MIVFTLIGVWELCKLGEKVDISSASRVHKHEWSSSGVRFFRSSDIMSAYNGTTNQKAFIPNELYEELIKKSGKVNLDDILVTGGGSVGVPYLVSDEKPLYFKDADLLWIKNSGVIDGQFLYTFFISPFFRKYIKSISHIGTISHYTIVQAKETPIKLPSFKEQGSIGSFFKYLDDTITLHQRKLEQLKELKKAYLQLMFPTKEERVPKLRFADFEGEWELCKLIGILDIIKGTQKSKSELSTNQNNCTPYPVYNGGINPSGYTNIYNRENAITISEGGNSAGFVNFVQEKFFSGGHNYTIVNNVTDTLFLFFYLCSIQEEIMRLRVGTGLPNIQKPTLMNLEIQKTTDNEQKFIGLFLKNIDILITLTQNKLNQLKSLKKSYLQNMFI
ncbi:restriction endonuclease subunit S [Enterococcus faecalis]|nr:restriction endonuclease subunit S [Enterococcus faecalis]ASU27316.1 restriction endonuclease subunit S [Enterococcus faecalis]MBA0041753.1 restriction endonuclease subunit S [Enterococcus faecalis]MBA0072662.1 restriction endonuclease subunit S [Enterococcus faecalis]MBA0091920.1 restriction endonuclease subunit S [Enterococcus faecalis]MCO8258818.1 restriction endonuclease subunit S [Enterococcus faecalis]